MSYEELIPESAKKEIAEHIIKKLLEDGYGIDEYTSDLHALLFEDFYIIGREEATEWINKHFPNIFDAIGLVQDFENEEFRSIKTDLSEPEDVVASIASIIGQEIINNSETIQWNNIFKENDRTQLIEEIKKEFLTD